MRDICGSKHVEDCLCCGETFPVEELDEFTGLCDECTQEQGDRAPEFPREEPEPDYGGVLCGNQVISDADPGL